MSTGSCAGSSAIWSPMRGRPTYTSTTGGGALLGIDRRWWRLASQDTARANAAEASRKLRAERDEHEEVEAYLRARRGTSPD